jgi:hypothetical protein
MHLHEALSSLAKMPRMFSMMSGFEKGVLGQVYDHAFDVLSGNRLKSSTL